MSCSIELISQANKFGKVEYPTTKGIVFGRLANSDIRIHAPGISDYHCQITFDKDQTAYIDQLGKTNGTMLNGLTIGDKTKLKNGDKIRILDKEFRFYYDKQSVTTPKKPLQQWNTNTPTITPKTPPPQYTTTVIKEGDISMRTPTSNKKPQTTSQSISKVSSLLPPTTAIESPSFDYDDYYIRFESSSEDEEKVDKVDSKKDEVKPKEVDEEKEVEEEDEEDEEEEEEEEEENEEELNEDETERDEEMADEDEKEEEEEENDSYDSNWTPKTPKTPSSPVYSVPSTPLSVYKPLIMNTQSSNTKSSGKSVGFKEPVSILKKTKSPIFVPTTPYNFNKKQQDSDNSDELDQQTIESVQDPNQPIPFVMETPWKNQTSLTTSTTTPTILNNVNNNNNNSRFSTPLTTKVNNSSDNIPYSALKGIFNSIPKGYTSPLQSQKIISQSPVPFVKGITSSPGENTPANTPTKSPNSIRFPTVEQLMSTEDDRQVEDDEESTPPPPTDIDKPTVPVTTSESMKVDHVPLNQRGGVRRDGLFTLAQVKTIVARSIIKDRMYNSATHPHEAMKKLESKYVSAIMSNSVGNQRVRNCVKNLNLFKGHYYRVCKESMDAERSNQFGSYKSEYEFINYEGLFEEHDDKKDEESTNTPPKTTVVEPIEIDNVNTTDDSIPTAILVPDSTLEKPIEEESAKNNESVEQEKEEIIADISKDSEDMHDNDFDEMNDIEITVKIPQYDLVSPDSKKRKDISESVTTGQKKLKLTDQLESGESMTEMKKDKRDQEEEVQQEIEEEEELVNKKRSKKIRATKPSISDLDITLDFQAKVNDEKQKKSRKKNTKKRVEESDEEQRKNELDLEEEDSKPKKSRKKSKTVVSVEQPEHSDEDVKPKHSKKKSKKRVEESEEEQELSEEDIKPKHSKKKSKKRVEETEEEQEQSEEDIKPKNSRKKSKKASQEKGATKKSKNVEIQYDDEEMEDEEIKKKSKKTSKKPKTDESMMDIDISDNKEKSKGKSSKTSKSSKVDSDIEKQVVSKKKKSKSSKIISDDDEDASIKKKNHNDDIKMVSKVKSKKVRATKPPIEIC
ncbi:hypothetical protein DLAC_02082 [Tieghemostelium lacteum]|uniref:FHA domain-containing protein n=1 Tax=Tieghemostelium lacteum TaxID=361077 RepID=A0A152A412_TIELA|nr:hypothetical protein DLAC_02082 [Tieghemostelium lacteum]|eukprot:KYR01003.1 hypothetical protein DLAC_02082 [Tieghemostelium lacteum]